jgi:type IV secretion system protein VirB4
MAFLREYRAEPDRLSDLLPWAALVAPGVVLNKDGSFLAAIRFRGHDPCAAIDGAAAAEACGLDRALAELGSGWALHLEARRRRLPDPPPPAELPDPVSWLVEAERREAFERAGPGFVTDYHLALQHLRPRGQAGDALGAFEETLDRIAGMLARLLPETEPLADAALLSWLAATVATAPRPVAMPETPAYLDELLAAEPLAGGPRPRLGDCHLRVVSLTGVAGSATPALLDALDRLGLEYRWAARTIALDPADARRLREGRTRPWFARRRGVATLLPVPAPSSPGAAFHDATVTLWDPDPGAADAAAAAVERLLNRHGLVARVETLNAVPAWLSSLPGQAYADVRRPPVGGLGVPQLLPLTAAWAGPPPGDGPAPLVETRGPGGTPFRLPFAVQGVAHKLVAGPAGPARATLTAFLALQARRYPGGRVAIVERGEGSLLATLAVGGRCCELRPGGAALLQPLAGIERPAERRWALHWLLQLLPPAGPEQAVARADGLNAALDALAAEPPPRRTLSALVARLADAALAAALRPWCAGGPLGPLLDAADETALEGAWICFETAGLAESPALAAAALACLLHRLPPAPAAPSLLILDGVLPWLESPAPLRERLDGPRQEGVVLAGDAAELAAAPLRGLLAAIPGRLFLPDPAAGEPERAAALARLGVEAGPAAALAPATPGQCWYRSPAGSRMLDLELGEVARAFCGPGSAEERARARELAARLGPAGFARQHLGAHGLAAIGELAVADAPP